MSKISDDTRIQKTIAERKVITIDVLTSLLNSSIKTARRRLKLWEAYTCIRRHGSFCKASARPNHCCAASSRERSYQPFRNRLPWKEVHSISYACPPQKRTTNQRTDGSKRRLYSSSGRNLRRQESFADDRAGLNHENYPFKL